MQVRYWLIVLAGVLALSALPLFLDSEEQKILNQLERLRGLAEVSAPLSNIQQLTRTREIAGYFREHTVYDLSNAGYGITEIHSRPELEQKILGAFNRISSLEVSLEEAVVHIEDDTARVTVRGSALGSLRGEEGRFLDIHLVDVLFTKEDDGWLVSGIRHLRDERQP
ncbi:MAG: hypothetical protein JSU75_07705 [Gammaproteobacteria bacterium]|nr:MAG: hypothetical protein JSU75_07705 [Gammaproteobacteria bacterium]